MKKLLSLLLAGSMLFSLSACGDEEKDKDEDKKHKADVIEDIGVEEKSENEAKVDTSEMYYISDLDSWISVPEEYKLFTRDMDESSPYLTERGTTKTEIVNYLDAYGSEFAAITPDDNMEVMFKYRKTGFGADNLISLDDKTIASFAEGLMIGYRTDSYELAEVNGVMWVKVKYSHSVLGSPVPAEYVKYTTVANGYDIYLWGASYDGKLTEQNMQELQDMLESFIFNAD